jgi:hypothetical protein
VRFIKIFTDARACSTGLVLKTVFSLAKTSSSITQNLSSKSAAPYFPLIISTGSIFAAVGTGGTLQCRSHQAEEEGNRVVYSFKIDWQIIHIDECIGLERYPGNCKSKEETSASPVSPPRIPMDNAWYKNTRNTSPPKSPWLSE